LQAVTNIDSEPSLLTDFILFGEYYEYITTVEPTHPRAKNVERSGGPVQREAPCHGTVGTMVNPPLIRGHFEEKRAGLMPFSLLKSYRNAWDGIANHCPAKKH